MTIPRPTPTTSCAPTPRMQYAAELAALAATDDRPRPPQWRLSPWAVTTYLLGGTLDDGTEITPKYLGSRRLDGGRRRLAGDRPGAAAARRARHREDLGQRAPRRRDQRRLDAASCRARRARRRSRCATAGTTRGCSPRARRGRRSCRARSCGPWRRARSSGSRSSPASRPTCRTRSSRSCREKTLPIPELDDEVQARQGFNVIATANNRDKGVNDLSSALKRRFNTVVLPLPDTLDAGGRDRRAPGSAASAGRCELPPELEALAEIERVVTIFRELRVGRHRRPAHHAQVAVGHALHRRGDLGDDQRAGPRRPLRRRRASGPTTSPPASSAPSSRTRSRTASCGRSTSRPSSRTAREWTDLYRACRELGLTHERSDVEVLGIRHHGPGSARSVARALDELQPDAGRSSRARPSSTRSSPLAADPDLVPPVAGARLRRRRAQAGGVLPAGRVLARVGRAAVGARPRRRRCASPTCPRRTHLADARAGRGVGRQQAAEEPRAPAPAHPTRPIGALAAAAGYDDPERWWEDAVEHRDTSTRSTRFAHLPRGDGRGAAAADGRSTATSDNERREAAMRQVLRAADRRTATSGSPSSAAPATHRRSPRRLPAGQPRQHAAHGPAQGQGRGHLGAVDRRPARRRAAATAPASPSPGWYQHLFTTPARGPTVVASWLVRVARALRDEELDASPALGRRGRPAGRGARRGARAGPRSGLAELDGRHPGGALRRLDAAAAARSTAARGRRRPGPVPETTPMVPLAARPRRPAAALRLKPSATAETVDRSTCARSAARPVGAAAPAARCSASTGACRSTPAARPARSRRRGRSSGSPSSRSR